MVRYPQNLEIECCEQFVALAILCHLVRRLLSAEQPYRVAYIHVNRPCPNRYYSVTGPVS